MNVEKLYEADLSLIIPCYNEESSLEKIVETTLLLENKGIKLELVIVDDCSKDSSLEIAKSLQAKYSNVKLFSHDKNQGKGAALRTGFIHATGKYVGIQDADMEYNPEDYITMLDAIKTNDADVVYGSRYLRPDSRRVLYFWHTWMNNTLTKVSNMFTNLDITDMETCYKLFKREVIHEIAKNLKENRFGFEPEVTALVSQGNYKVYECAIHYNPRSYEEGKKIGWKDGVRALYCIFHYSAHTAPVPMKLIIYFFIGGFSAIANLIAFAIARNYAALLWQATATAFIISAFINYFLCIQILFKHNARWNSFTEIITYIITLLIMGFVDYACTFCFAQMGIALMWSKAWAAVIGFFGNYILRKLFVFGGKRN